MPVAVIRNTIVGLCLAMGIPAALDGQAKQATPAGPPISRDWKRLRSDHFIAEGTAGGRSLQRWLENLETFRACMQELFPKINLASSVPNHIVVVRDRNELLALAPLQTNGRPDPKVAGYFQPQPDVNYFVVSNETDSAESILYHEYTHFILHNGIPGPMAGWVSEGLAEFYSTFVIDRGRRQAIIGHASPRMGVMRDGFLIPINKMITEEGEAEHRRDDLGVQRFYAQAWAMVHYLVIGHGGKREDQLVRYIDAMASGTPSEAAFKAAFQTEPSTLLNELKGYLLRKALPGVILRIPDRATSRAALEPMFEWESQLSRGRLLTQLGRLEDAEKYLHPAREAAPNDSGVQHAMGALRRAQGRPTEAVEILKSAIALKPDAFGPRLEYGRALTDAGLHETAISEYRSAQRLNVREPSLWFGLSVSLAATGKDEEASIAFARLRLLDANPWWFRSRARAAWRAGLDQLVIDDTFRYTTAVGYKSESGTYAAFLGLLSGRRIKDMMRTTALVGELQKAIKPKSWPSDVLAFLQGTLAPTVFIDRADGNGELTQAHAYIGLVASIDGLDQEALLHLQWVVDRGSQNYVEYGLVLDELARRGLPIRPRTPAK